MRLARDVPARSTSNWQQDSPYKIRVVWLQPLPLRAGTSRARWPVIQWKCRNESNWQTSAENRSGCFFRQRFWLDWLEYRFGHCISARSRAFIQAWRMAASWPTDYLEDLSLDF